MTSYREMHEIGRDPARIKSIAQDILAVHGHELDDWKRGFLKDMATWKGGRDEALSTRQAETLIQIRDGLKRYSKVDGIRVKKLIEDCWMARLDLDEDDEDFIVRVRGSFDLRRGELMRLLRCARQLNLIEGYIDIG